MSEYEIKSHLQRERSASVPPRILVEPERRQTISFKPISSKVDDSGEEDPDGVDSIQEGGRKTPEDGNHSPQGRSISLSEPLELKDKEKRIRKTRKSYASLDAPPVKTHRRRSSTGSGSGGKPVETTEDMDKRIEQGKINTKTNQRFVKKFHLDTPDEVLVGEFSCALRRSILLQGKLYYSENYICFYSGIFGSKTRLVFAVKEISELLKDGRSIEIRIGENKHSFTNFLNRERCFQQLWHIWIRHPENKEKADALSQPSFKSLEIDPENLRDTSEMPLEDDLLLYSSDEEVSKSLLQEINSGWTTLLDAKFPGLTVPAFFKRFFADGAEFTRLFHDDRKEVELVVGTWASIPEYKGHVRQKSFVAPLNVPLGPKSTRTEETQRYFLQQKRLLLESSNHFLDAPYGDAFLVQYRWKVDEIDNGVSVHLEVGVFFQKKLFEFIRKKIQDGTISSCKETYARWLAMAQEHMKNRALSPPPTAAPAPLRPSSTTPAAFRPVSKEAPTSATPIPSSPTSPTAITLTLSIPAGSSPLLYLSLVFLLCVNVWLFWTVSDQRQQLAACQKPDE